MNNIDSTTASNTMHNTEFANPELAKFAKSFQIKSEKSYGKSIFYEICAWLVLPLIFPLFWLFFVILIFAGTILSALYALIFLNLESGEAPRTFVYILVVFASLYSTYLSYLIITKFFFRLRRIAKRNRIDALNTLKKNPNDPILYLRSFIEDTRNNPERRNQRTFEEDLVLALGSFGPVIAVGSPEDKISPLGATRIYLNQDEWQEKVKKLMEISQLVVIHAGPSDGLIWELEAAIENTDPNKVIISFHSWSHLDKDDPESEYRQFKFQFENYMNQSESPVTISLPESIGNASFMVFSGDWTPESVEISRWKKLFYKFSHFLVVNETLRPILKKRDLNLKWWKNAVYILFFSFLFCGSVWTILWFAFLNKFEDVWLIGLLNGILGQGVFVVVAWLIPNTIIFLYRKFMKLVPSRRSGLQETIGLKGND